MGRILITGCSSRIGRACVVALSQRGHAVIATARDPATLNGLPAVATLALDVRDNASVSAAVAAAGPVDVLVNNAGVTTWSPAELLPVAELWRVIDTNLIGVARVTQAVLPGMRARRHGRIVNVSTGTVRGYPLLAAYAASKAAMEAWTETLRLEVARFGVDVLLVEPGGVETSFGRNRVTVDVADEDYKPMQDAILDAISSLRSDPMTAAFVADRVADLVEAESPPLRNPLGDTAAAFSAERATLDDAAYEARVLTALGLERPS